MNKGEHLQVMLARGEYLQVLAARERLLAGEVTLQELMRIHDACLKAAMATGQMASAVVWGHLVADLAQEAGQWRVVAEALMNLGCAQSHIGDHTAAATTFWRWLSLRDHFPADVQRMVGLVYYNLGVVAFLSGDEQAALGFYARGRELAERMGVQRLSHGIRQAQITIMVHMAALAEVPRLLAQSLAYLRRCNCSELNIKKSYLWHGVIRSRYALRTNRPRRAVRVAKAYQRRFGSPQLDAWGAIHQVLGEAYVALGESRQALPQFHTAYLVGLKHGNSCAVATALRWLSRAQSPAPR